MANLHPHKYSVSCFLPWTLKCLYMESEWTWSYFQKSEIIKEERKKEERNRDSSGGCLASWLNLHLSGRCTVLRKPEDCFFSEMLWFQFSLSAWRYIFLSRVCLVLGFTLHDNYTSAVVCLHLLFLVSCTVITKSRVPRKVHWFHWFECDFCWLHYIFTRGGGSFPCPLFCAY